MFFFKNQEEKLIEVVDYVKLQGKNKDANWRLIAEILNTNRSHLSVKAKYYNLVRARVEKKQQNTTHTRLISEQSSEYGHYISGLQRHSLHVVSVAGDGNCLFRSVAHQLYGNDELHTVVRQQCMDYMKANAEFFSQFIEGGIEAFDLYVTTRRQLACWGDHLEIQAMCELYCSAVEIWSYDQQFGARIYHTFQDEVTTPRIRLSHYGGGHYDSLVYATEITDKSTRDFIHPDAIEDTNNIIRSIRTCPPAVTAYPLVNKISSNERDLIENAALIAALKISREEFMSWHDTIRMDEISRAKSSDKARENQKKINKKFYEKNYNKKYYDSHKNDPLFVEKRRDRDRFRYRVKSYNKKRQQQKDTRQRIEEDCWQCDKCNDFIHQDIVECPTCSSNK